ncbi:hypothetical protein TH53_07375 [Pedobacter lusitanus]|uniref:Uncharacterized protein n=1 Tax=Pedobacter lusitanus TaxID=1503925 RepID=A0A0D0FYZ4_9SPHI|nr:polymer-forming cytoskeletal protein [Pedobacter lusitanus]KIO77744.1 hypothetical protein TH53_07375 [Pedobacter lusitanus]
MTDQPDFNFITFKELLALDSFAKSWETIFPYQHEEFEDDSLFIISKGHTDFTDHLRLDTDCGWTANDKKWIAQFPGLQARHSDELIQGLIILGDLSVQGSILNEEGDYGAFLLVTGQVSCQSIVAGGSVIYIKGDITTEEVFISHYNHGYFKGDGLTTSPILIIEDHYTTLASYNASLFYYNDKTGDCPPGNECYEDEETGEDWLCSPNLTRLLDNPVFTFEDLIADLNEGEYVLASSNRLVYKDEAYWLQKAYKHLRNLRRTPELFKSARFFEKTYWKYGSVCFPHFPDTFITAELCIQGIQKSGMNLRYIPGSMITSELCELAAQHKTSISFIPPAYLDAKLIKEIIHYNESEMQAVPPHLITEELLIDYVKLGRGLWLDKYCQLADVSKITVLFKALDSGIESIEEIWGFHFQEAVYLYAKKLYNNAEHELTWSKYVEKFQQKIDRLAG